MMIIIVTIVIVTTSVIPLHIHTSPRDFQRYQSHYLNRNDDHYAKPFTWISTFSVVIVMPYAHSRVNHPSSLDDVMHIDHHGLNIRLKLYRASFQKCYHQASALPINIDTNLIKS